MNESQNNFNEELNTNVDNSVDTSINDIPAPTQPKAPFTAEEPVRPSIDEPIKPVIEEPVAPAATSSIDNGNKKGNKGLIIIIIVLVALLLGAVGYIAYSNGWFGEKETEPTSKETEKEETKKEVKEQVINYDFSKYESTATNAPVEAGTITIKEKDYKITFMRYDCAKGGQLPNECTDGYNYLTDISVSSSDGTLIKNIRTEKGIATIAVLDDRYLFIDTGKRPDSTPALTSNLLILDSENQFAEIEKYSYTFRSYSKIENGNNVSNSDVTRKVGYVDKNSYKIATCNKSTTTTYHSQKYTEYIITVKDGVFSEKEDYSIDSVFCSAQY